MSVIVGAYRAKTNGYYGRYKVLVRGVPGRVVFVELRGTWMLLVPGPELMYRDLRSDLHSDLHSDWLADPTLLSRMLKRELTVRRNKV